MFQKIITKAHAVRTHLLTLGVIIATAVAMTPLTVYGQSIIEGEAGGFGDFVGAMTTLINQYLIPFMIALAVLGFIYGVFLFFIMGSSDEEKRAQGRALMGYALIGFVAIIALWGIVYFLAQALGFETGGGAGSVRGPDAG